MLNTKLRANSEMNHTTENTEADDKTTIKDNEQKTRGQTKQGSVEREEGFARSASGKTAIDRYNEKG